MRLLLEYPGIPLCATCQKYMVDYDHSNGVGSGEIKTWGPPDKQQPHLRPMVCPPPCRNNPRACPKISPEREPEFILSDRNWRTLEFYRETKAVNGLSEEEARDGMVRRSFALLDRIFRRAEQGNLADAVSSAVSSSIASLFSRGK